MPELTKIQTGFIEAQSPLELDSGTQSAPSIHFEGDENTGLYKAAEDEIGVSIGGTEKYKFTSEGLKFNGTSLDGSPHIGKIDKDIADTAVDVFVYDTSKDSDGGAWRKRTQSTSWYNETLNTSTRGTRKEFPAVAVLVLSANKLTIYDGDDPDLPMWMEVYQYVGGGNSGTTTNWHGGSGTFSAVAAINGIIICGTTGTRNLHFVNDRFSLFYSPTSGDYTQLGGISNRNVAYTNWSPSDQYYAQLVNTTVNDVAMTVLPNAPVDPSTQLPIPTIAVATNGGISVIKDNGTIITGGDTIAIPKIHISKENRLYYTFVGYSQTREVFGPNSWTSSGFYGSHQMTGTGSYPTLPTGSGNGINITTGAYGKNAGLFLHDPDPVDIPSDPDNNNGMVAYIKSDYNTGWMHGDIKGAFLSDTTAESLTANTNLVSTFTQSATARLTSETYDDGDTDWQMVDDAGSVNGYVMITMPNLTVGQTYFISMTWDNNAATDNSAYAHKIVHKDGLSGQNDTIFTDWNKTNGSPETLTGLFTAQTTNDDVLLIYVNAITLNITNFNVRAVDDEDRSVNNKGLQVYGTVTKTAVATGAELVAYSGNGSSNYLAQPYNSDLDFGLNSEFSITGWMYNTPVGGGQYIFDRSVTQSTSRDWQLWVAADLRYMAMYIDGGQAVVTPNGSFPNNVWFQYCVVRKGNRVIIYINGVEIANTASTLSTIPASNVPIKLLLDNHSSTKQALLRISASAPSPEQIKKIYEDEKVLFQENAKATLYGSSDAVTALAFDDTTNLLHVGTSAGRSEFQGLRRINNTTDAVTTAISASNGLVAEQ